MWENEFENAVSGIPAGLISCRLNGTGVHIARIAKNALWLRLSTAETPGGTLEVCFREFSGRREIISIEDYQTGEARCENCGVLIRFSFDHPAFSRAFHRAMSDYADYVRAFEQGDVASLAGCQTGSDDDFADEPFDLSFLRLSGNRETCVSLHEPELYELYLNHSLDGFLDQYEKKIRVPKLPKIHRLYIGNGFCRQLFPDETTLRGLIHRAGEDGLAVTLVTAPDPRIPEDILKNYSGEIVVNDWGLLYHLQSYSRIQPVLGTLLNKHRKDPRMSSKPDLNPLLLRENALNSPEFRVFLRELGVNRWEYERCGYDCDVPEGHASLHMPYYQTNTSVYCPLRALCEHGDRGSQSDDENCPRYCRNNGQRYPARLKTVARWNSIFALDDRPIDDLSAFDRVVLNL